jgi:hypothetical protein
MAISVASRSTREAASPSLPSSSGSRRSISRPISSWTSRARFFWSRPQAARVGFRSCLAQGLVDLEQPFAEGTELLVGIHLPLELVEPGSRPQLYRLGLTLQLGGERVVGTMAGVVWGRAGTGGFAAAAEGSRDGALAHVSEPAHLAQDRVALVLQGVDRVRHGTSDPIVYILSERRAQAPRTRRDPQP